MNWLDLFGDMGKIGGAEDASQPMYAQITKIIEDAIVSGDLKEDTKLPTNRELASLLKVDRSTISRAYLELSQKGLIDSHVGRGTYVRISRSPRLAHDGGTAIVWSDKFSRSSQIISDILGRQPVSSSASSEMISFAGGIPTDEFYPSQDFERIVEQLIASKEGTDMFGYSPAEGHPALRTEVKSQLRAQGIDIADDQLLIVSGSQQGIDLVSSTLVDEDDVVLLEEPTYFWALTNFRARKARIVPVAMDEGGINTNALESILQRQKAKLLYLMPNFQNPTGATLPLNRRKAIVELARKYQLPVLEDNFVGDLTYEGEQLPPLRALPGAAGHVIHQGTFSKALCPGLRLGWLVAPPEVMTRLTAAKRSSDLSTNSIAQIILAKYLREGLYGRHLEHVRTAYRKRRDTMLGALSKHFGPISSEFKVTWQKPHGGLFMWMKLPDGFSARDLLVYAEREGVTFSPGDLFFVRGDQMEYMRLCFIQSDEATIEEGIGRLAKAAATYFENVRGLSARTTLKRSAAQSAFV